MRRSKPVVLVICEPVENLYEQYPSIVVKPYIGEIPLGVLYLAGELERAGFEVVVKDNTIDKIPNERLAAEISSLSPLLVGFSLTLFNIRNSRDVARLFKEESSNVPVIFGGPHATIMPTEQAILDFVDIVITHQGEISLREIAEQIRHGSYFPVGDPKKKIVRGKTPLSLDDLAFPARHLVDINKYNRKSLAMDITPTDYMCSSRGCPFQCAFCSSKIFWERKYYTRKPSSIVDEIETLMGKYGSKGIYFREDNFTIRKHNLGVCKEMIRRKLDIKWECESRVDTVSKEDLAIMKEAGCAGIWCGVESGSQRILDSIKKGYKIKQVQNFFDWCRDVDISTFACFMLGFPGENKEDILETYELAINLPVKRVQFATYVGFPRSEIYDEILKNSLWEARWEDILITRNEKFTTKQLYTMEAVMNRDANKTIAVDTKPGLSIWIKRIIKSFLDPYEAIKRMKSILLKRLSAATGKQENIYELLDRFSRERQRSNP